MEHDRKREQTVRDKGGKLPDYQVYKLTPADILREGTLGMALSALISYTFYKSLAVFLILLPLSFIAFPLLRKNALKQKRLWALTVQFKDAIWILSGFLSSGTSVENAFMMTVPELIKLYGEKSCLVEEFSAINRGIKLNKPIEPMLNDFAARSGLPDIQSFTEVFSIAKRNGGSLKEIIERTGTVIREKTAVSEEIKNLTASKRYEQNIMSILPFAIVIYINLTSRGFLDVLYEGVFGRIIMTVCLVLIIGSCVASQKILDIRV